MTLRTPLFALPAAIFLVNAVLYVTLYSRLPEVTAAQGISRAALGLALLAQTGGTLLGFPLAARVIERFGARRVAGATLLVAMLLLPLAASGRLAPGLAGLALPLFGYGFAMAIMEVAKNLIAARIEEKSGRNVISKCHGFWSAGLFVGAVLGGWAASRGMSAASELALLGAASLPLVILLLLRAGDPEPLVTAEAPVKGPRFARPDAFVIGLLILIAGFSITEGVIYDWSMFYLREELGLGALSASRIYAAFTIGMFAARMSGDGLRARLRVRILLRMMAVTTLAGLVLCIASPSAGLGEAGLLAGFALVGAGVALGAPVATSLAMRHPTRSATKTMAAYSLTSLLALFAVPPLLGGLVEAHGAVWALTVSTPLLLVVLLGAGRIVGWMGR
ncbi:MFS transporter [Alloyangia pacifica]|uniref:Fucose permease n=1 Tax=Alloyangia pacifica TaxID=311180 RepID=A0A1I6UPQ5_9RHOB|nr:MFS transporter [Alloyangia pacifica]SDH77395.1 Fucose permease [Alloyangia pacifica]SFT03334.1 Fucose permease [Alloyangia pacifica]